MTWADVDFDNVVWNKPAEHMKTGKPHRVPLSDQAVAVLRKARKLTRGRLVFSGQRAKVLGQNTIHTLLLRSNVPASGHRVPHLLQGVGERNGRAGTAVGVRLGPRRGVGNGRRLRARRPAGEAPPGHAGLGGRD